MNREVHTDEMIDLGSITEETRGSAGFSDDQHGGQLGSGGLSDD